MQPPHLTEGLNPSQYEAVTTDAAPLCILAGAGSGKTRVLTRRIAHRVLFGTADAPHVLALTFTRKAAGELRSRLSSLGVRDQVVAGTFHSVAYAQLRRRWSDRGERPPALLDRKVRLIAPLLGRHRPASAAVQPGDLAAEIEWAKARMIPASRYEAEANEAGRKPPLPAPVMAAVYESYEADKRKRGLVDFDDLLGLCARALQTDEEFAATQRWRFRHLFVDEFQDVNPVQFSLLTGWLGDRPDLCVVGDPNQAIYSWNGADPTLLTGFGRLFPGGATVRLDDNYRSTPQVLSLANAVLASPGPDATPGRGAPALRATRPEGPLPSVQCYPTDVAEARGVAARIRRSHGPTRPWSHFAVLARTNAQGLLFEQAFRDASVPYRVRGGGAFLHQAEVKEALAEMARMPAAVAFSSRIADLEAMARSEVGTEERRLSLDGLVRLAREYVSLDQQASVAGFSAWLAATVKGDEPDSDGDAVDIVTFHRAKGLEWPVVHVAGLERGLVPIGRAETPEAEAEERRLLYVALTRGRDELSCSWAERRTFGERSVSRSPSPWLSAIEAAIRAMRVEGPSGDWRQYLDRERTRLRALDGGRRAGAKGRPALQGLGAEPDPEVFAALKAWRARAAKAANVPAYVIFHDTTLAAVAELRPRSREALLRVPGLGPVKAERYAAELLALVSEHARTA